MADPSELAHFISPLGPRSMEVLRGERSALIVGAEGCGKTILAHHLIRETAPTLGAYVPLDGGVDSVFESVWLALAGRVRTLFERDPRLLARAAERRLAAGVALRMVEEHTQMEGYALDFWFLKCKAAGLGESELTVLQAAMASVPAHAPIRSCAQLIDEIGYCREATRLKEQSATLWIEVAPSFDWQRHGPALAELVSRRRVRGGDGISVKLLLRPADRPKLHTYGIQEGDFAGEELTWGFEALVAAANQATEGWFTRFSGTADGQRRLQVLFDGSLDGDRRQIAASPRCWIALAQILRARELSRIVEERDWHLAIRDCCAATRKLRISSEGIFVGGDRIDARGMLSPMERMVLTAIVELQKTAPPSAGEIATFINGRRGGNRTASQGSIPRAISVLRNKPYFEPVFYLRASNAESQRAEYTPEYLVYLHNEDSGRQYRLENIV